MSRIAKSNNASGHQEDAPILEALIRYAATTRGRFHTPGHKGGKGAHLLLRRLAGSGALNLDLGLAGNLDSLQEPATWIAKAQELAADLYAADSSFFLVNGTTCGIHAMVMSVAGPGEKVIVTRNAHRSVAGAIVLSGCMPVFVIPRFDNDLHLSVGVTAETVEGAISLHPDAKAILLTNPTYHGVTSDLERIVDSAHQRGIPVLVDEAHGPHLRFCNRLPVSAMDAGADLCVQSTHKLLGSLTQSSLLHSRGTLVDGERLKSMLRILQSTSPNYLLLASLDIARLQMASQGVNLINHTVDLAEQARIEINEIDCLYCFGKDRVGSPGIFGLDPTKLTVSTEALGLPGREIERLLREDFGIQPELSDDLNILFLLTLADREPDLARLISALRKIVRSLRTTKSSLSSGYMELNMYSRQLDQAMSPREAVFSKRRRVQFAGALGEVSAEMLSVYPPGIPILWPGERVDREAILYCTLAAAAGARLIGLKGGAIGTLDVVA